MKRIRLACLLLLALAALASSSVGATSAHSFQCGGWSIVPGPNPNGGQMLNAVAAVSASDVWAVGNGPLIEHWDGTSWQVVPSPNPGEVTGLLGVTAVSANDIWTVGYYTSVQSGYLTLTEHWNGSQWSIVPSPSIGNYYERLNAVTAVSSNDVWAVGTALVAFNSRYQTLIEHWDGIRWSIVQSPNGGHIDRSLNGVTALSANDVWAVGSYIQSYTNYALTEHWDGSRWSIVPAPGGQLSNLSAVMAVNAGQVWAVGWTLGTLTERWNGHHWQVVPSHSPGKGRAALFGVAASSTQDGWAVGYYANNNGGDATLTEHWNGTSWQVVSSPNMPSDNSFLYGVAMVPGSHHAWAVGFSEPAHDSGITPLIEYYC
jgi:hypothetical protein